MIRAMGKASDRVSKAAAVCDGCGREEVITCDYQRTGHPGGWQVDEGQAVRKMQGRGWALVKGRLLCAKCEARRKAVPGRSNQEGGGMATASAAPPREPTREQKRDIHGMLTAAYDVKAGCYCGGETDKTVAETLGGGILPGWVAAVREEYFGPSGGNEEIAALTADLAAARDAAASACQFAAAAARTAETARAAGAAATEAVSGLQKRLEALKKAIGPKVTHV